MADNGEIKPVSLRDNTPSATPPGRDSRSQGVIYGFAIMIVAVLVVVILLATSFAAGDDESLNEAEIRRIAEEVARTQIASAALGGASGASDAEIQQLIDDAVGTKVAAIIPTNTPIPPTPTIIPVGVAEDDDAFVGAENGRVVIVEFGDYQCGFCGRWYQETLPKILETYPDDVKFIYRDFVIFGEESLRAAEATECADEQGKFWDMSNRLYDRLLNREESPLNDDTFISYAEDFGMDTAAFSECLISERYADEVMNDFNAAQAYGLRGTPGFVINGVVYPIGAQPFEVFSDIIQGEITRLENES